MQKNKFDILHEIENMKISREKFDEYTKDTYKYVDKYKDYFPEGHKGGWNDSVDAFRHAYMQAHLKYKYGDFISKNIANLHERNGNKYFGQSKEEEYMDEWNNSQGREIADEVKKEIKILGKKLSDKEIKDYIAFKVIQKMREGKIIRNIDEATNMMNKKQNPTVKTLQNRRESIPEDNTSQKKIPAPYKTPSQKFSDEIRQKLKAKNLESNKRLNRILNFHNPNPNLENGHWVTMNGAHVFIEDK